MKKQNTEKETKMSDLTKKLFTSFTKDKELLEQVKSFPSPYNKSKKYTKKDMWWETRGQKRHQI